MFCKTNLIPRRATSEMTYNLFLSLLSVIRLQRNLIYIINEGGPPEELGSRSAIYETLVENVSIETSWDKGRNKETQSESIETLRSEERQKSSNWDTGAAPFPGPLTTSSPYKALSHPSLSFLMSLRPVALPRLFAKWVVSKRVFVTKTFPWLQTLLHSLWQFLILHWQSSPLWKHHGIVPAVSFTWAALPPVACLGRRAFIKIAWWDGKKKDAILNGKVSAQCSLGGGGCSGY